MASGDDGGEGMAFDQNSRAHGEADAAIAGHQQFEEMHAHDSGQQIRSHSRTESGVPMTIPRPALMIATMR